MTWREVRVWCCHVEEWAEGPGPALDEPRAHWGSCSLLVSEPCPVSEPSLQPNGWNLCVLFSPRHRLLGAANPGNPHSSGLVGRVLDVRPCWVQAMGPWQA